jgi:MOSC domain-containing protein YiiM
VNIARARLLMMGTGPQKTGIFKQPVAGRVELRDDAVAGDRVVDTAVHGGYDKAVYAYAAEDYDWWMEQLGRELPRGWFGENLTTVGVAIADAAIGERWRVGTALLEVSEPRQPCSTLGAKMGDQRFVKAFARALRLGTYLRIIEPGDVGAGDPIEIVERPGHGITIGLLSRVLFEDSTLGPRILAADKLTDGWRARGEKLAARAGARSCQGLGSGADGQPTDLGALAPSLREGREQVGGVRVLREARAGRRPGGADRPSGRSLLRDPQPLPVHERSPDGDAVRAHRAPAGRRAGGDGGDDGPRPAGDAADGGRLQP